MRSRFDDRTSNEKQRQLIYLIRKFVSNIKLDSGPEQLKDLREEIRQLMNVLGRPQMNDARNEIA